MKTQTPILAALLVALASHSAVAKPLIPGPGDPGHDAKLAAKAEAFYRQQQALSSLPLGFGLETFVAGAANRKLVDDFFATGTGFDFKASSGKHAYEVISHYGEVGDLGMFGGVQAAGDAFRYAVLRDGKAPAAQVDAARKALLRAMDGLHWQTAVTGTPGLVARGVMRIAPETGDPPLPDPPPATTPLKDAQGNPLPKDKKITWRDDLSGKLPFMAWMDDCSKDQLDGYVMALGVIYDVVQGDSTIPPKKVDRLKADALAIGQQLMKKVEVAPGVKADLVIMDADGRPTTYHDLSAEEVSAGIVMPTPWNGFNGLLGLSMIRAVYHITGDSQVGKFYYDELVKKRGYMNVIDNTIQFIYLGTNTNYSNVNMAFVAVYSLLRYEKDPVLAKRLRSILEKKLYGPNFPRQAKGTKMSLFDVIYAGFRDGGASGDGATAVADGLETLSAFPDPPYWNPKVENCDAAEIAAKKCTAVDGSTIIDIAPTAGWGGKLVATKAVPKSLRPPSNYEWRSDPHSVNGGGGDRLNPGGGFHCAYWMGRFLEDVAGQTPNVSPNARLAPGTAPDAGPPLVDGGVGDSGIEDGASVADAKLDDAVPPTADATVSPDVDDSGCGCSTSPRSGGGALLLILALLAMGARRRRGSRGR